MPAHDAASPLPLPAAGANAPDPGPEPGPVADAGPGVESEEAPGRRRPSPRVDPGALEIEPARAVHARGIVELRDRLARWMIGRGIDQWREGEYAVEHVAQEVERGEWWVVESPEDPARVLASVRVIWEDPEIWGEQPVPAGYIHGVAVDRSLSGTGTGSRLVRAAERAIAASGRTVARLDCDVTSPPLQPFYTGLGYSPRGAVDFDVPGMDYRVRVMRMERSLPQPTDPADSPQQRARS